jgi:effector-binding domain-containing protein
MTPAVREVEVAAVPTAVIVETTSWGELQSVWPRLLDEVWAVVRSHELVQPGRNVMLYRDDVPHVEIGVEAAAPFPAIGRVVASKLPAGRALTATHRGPFEALGLAHEALRQACAERGLLPVWPRWEIYAHWDERDPKPEVEVYYLVA